jgi:hypothetical protein
MLFEQEALHRTEENRQNNMNGEHRRIWKKVVMLFENTGIF